VENENRKRNDSVFSRKIRAGRRRTYFFDVRTTRGNDYYLTITESKKRFDGNGYERHKIFLYKEDFNKFIEETTAVIDHIKSLMPDFDFDAFSHKYEDQPMSEHESHDGSRDEHTEERQDEHHEEEHHEEERNDDHHEEESHDDRTENNSNSGFDQNDDDLKL
jgi:hypothetical protein